MATEKWLIPIPKFETRKMADSTVYRMLSAGSSLEEIIAVLSTEKAELMSRIKILESIAPRKLRARDGTVLIWRCEDESIPIEDVP